MRVGILAFLHESNTFLPEKTTLAKFEQDILVEGEAVRERMGSTHHEVAGFFEGLANHGTDSDIEIVPIFAARALPYGTITADTFDEILRRLLAALDRAGPLDGLLLAPHGATVAENYPDADGEWLTRVRQAVGPKIPLIATLDLHANLSPKMVAACDAIFPYRTNPHLDQKQQGLAAAALMIRTLRGEVSPVMAAAFPPLAVNIERQASAEPHWKPLFDLADSMTDLLSTSFVYGFPYADVAEMGSAVIAVADGDRAVAERAANALAREWWKRRADFAGEFISVAEAVQRAGSLDGPVCLLDMGDNVGGGSPGDGTFLAHELLKQKVGPAFVCLADQPAVWAAVAAGVGNRVRMSVGGKSDDRHGPPIEDEFTVVGLYDGKFRESVVRHGGWTHFDQGDTAVVTNDSGLTLMLTSRRMVPFSLSQLTTFGLDPTSFHVLVAKGVHAPVAAYAPISKHLMRVDTPGATSANLARLHYEHRRVPMYPFERDTEWA